MKDYQTHEFLKKINCFWCRNSFNTTPIGCPISYVSPQIIKKYFSEVTKDYYTIKENISLSVYKKYEESGKFNENGGEINKTEDNPKIKYEIQENNFYHTDGVFCSFNCCLSFIRDNINNPLYKNSTHLLQHIYFKIFNVKCKIEPSPHWRMLKEYGGSMNINEFRASFNKIIYKPSHHIKEFPKNKMIGMLYEENLKI